MIDFNELMDKELAENPKMKAEYDRLKPIYRIKIELIKARQAAGLTQAQIAARMGTTQSVVARMECEDRFPSLDLVSRYGKATGRQIALIPIE